MKKRNQSITVGIPTCYSGDSLVRTVESIRNAELGNSARILITADRTPMSSSVKKALKKLNAEVTWNSVEGSQFRKIKQMVKKAEPDLYIHTQDDVIFDRNTIATILDSFTGNKDLTMAGIRILPLKQKTLFESAMASMLLIVDNIARGWNKTDNHLSSSGRCLAFRTKHLKKFRIPEEVVNGDMFFYLENKRLKGTFLRIKDSKVFIRCPQRLKDQIAPSSRYLYSKKEMQKYFTQKLDNEYSIPVSLVLLSFVKYLIRRPIPTVLYSFVRVYTFIVRQSDKTVSNPIWKVEASTKVA